MKKSCSRCGTKIDCQLQSICWCIVFPPIPKDSINDNTDCMCKKCLAKTYFERIFS
jgi:hypothetical protein